MQSFIHFLLPFAASSVQDDTPCSLASNTTGTSFLCSASHQPSFSQGQLLRHHSTGRSSPLRDQSTAPLPRSSWAAHFGGSPRAHSLSLCASPPSAETLLVPPARIPLGQLHVALNHLRAQCPPASIPAQLIARSRGSTAPEAVEGAATPRVDSRDACRRRWGWRACGPASGRTTAPPSVWDRRT